MKRTYKFAHVSATVSCRLSKDRVIVVPVVPGILKHPTTGLLQELLGNPHVVRKYTIEALRRAPWPILRQFPRNWLLECLNGANLDPPRLAAITFLLS